MASQLLGLQLQLLARVSSNKYGVRDILERERLELPVGRVQLKAKPKGRGPSLEETRLDPAIRSSVAITKLLLGRDILKKKKKKTEQENGEMRFFKNIFSLDFLKTFWLSYKYIQHHYWFRNTAVSFMEKFCVKAGISCRFILY